VLEEAPAVPEDQAEVQFAPAEAHHVLQAHLLVQAVVVQEVVAHHEEEEDNEKTFTDFNFIFDKYRTCQRPNN
jgi:hypothetical protein